MSETTAYRIACRLGAMRTSSDGKTRKAQSQFLGHDWVAILYAAAHLTDVGWCLTADSLSRYAGMSRGTCSGKLVHLVRSSWLEIVPAECGGAECSHRRTHYRLEV